MTVRNVHTPTLSKREKLSMLNITSKIMSASVSDFIILNEINIIEWPLNTCPFNVWIFRFIFLIKFLIQIIKRVNCVYKK